MLDPGHFCADLFNALSARGVWVSQARYRAGGWSLRIQRPGGYLRGVAIVECLHYDAPRIRLRVRTLLRSRPVADWPLADFPNADACAARLCDTLNLPHAPSAHP
jgi:hypothetical protein